MSDFIFSGRRIVTSTVNEERNVLDDLLLNNQEDDDFDSEFINKNSLDKNTHRGLEWKKSKAGNNNSKKVTKKSDHKLSQSKIKNSSNGSSKKQKSFSPPSDYSSSSCSCEDHSSMADSPAHEDVRNHRESSYQSFTRSPSLKIQISKNSDSRTIRRSLSLSENQIDNRKRKAENEYYRKENSKKFKIEKSYHDEVRRKEIRSDRNDKLMRSEKKRDYSSLIKYFFKDSCYFVMKSNNAENVAISKREGVWSTPKANELKLNNAFKQFRNVILIFSVKESGKFQGFARLASEVQYDLEPVHWVLPPGVNSCPFDGIFFVDWINRNELSFVNASHLYNIFNDNKPVKIARDGQEIEPKVGEELCRLFASDNRADLIPLLKRMKKQTTNRSKKNYSRGPFMSLETLTLKTKEDNEYHRSTNDYRLNMVKNPKLSHQLSSSSHYTYSIKKRIGHEDMIKETHSSNHYHHRENRSSRPMLKLRTYSDSYPQHIISNGYGNNRYSDKNGMFDGFRRHNRTVSTSSSHNHGSTIYDRSRHRENYHRDFSRY